MITDIHTHRLRDQEGVDSRMSYRVGDTIQTGGLYSIGLHPCYVEDMTDEALQLLREHLSTSRSKVWAIGEAGLDKFSVVDYSLQMYYFREQIRLSEAYALPLVVHCVRSYSEILKLRKELSPRMEWIIHGFRKGEVLARQLIELGCALSFGEYFSPEALEYAYHAKRMYLETDTSSLLIEEVYAKAYQSLLFTAGLEPLL